jgi:hypothetical protein
MDNKKKRPGIFFIKGIIQPCPLPPRRAASLLLIVHVFNKAYDCLKVLSSEMDLAAI